MPQDMEAVINFRLCPQDTPESLLEHCRALVGEGVELDYVQQIGASSASAFVTAYDLFTLTNYKGQDPEVTLPSSVTALAQDNSSTPRSRRFSMGITLNF